MKKLFSIPFLADHSLIDHSMLNFVLIVSVLIASVLAAVSCQETNEALLDEPSADLVSVSQPAFKNAIISTQVEQQGGASTKTALRSDDRVIWSAGDSFSLLSQIVRNVLVVKVNATSSGLGIPVSVSSGSCDVRYTGIKITDADGTDITSQFTGISATSSNSYKVGIYNVSHCYQYASAGTTVSAEINSNKLIPIVQSSSSANVSSEIYVQLQGIQYKIDGVTSWTDVNEKTSLDNGFSQEKNTVTYTWSDEISSSPQNLTYSSSYTYTSSVASNAQFSIVSGEGEANASFKGKIPSGDGTSYGFYPYSSSSTFDGEKISFSLPQTQTYAAESFASGANPSVGELVMTVNQSDTTYNISFRNVCGVLELQLKGTQIVTGITVTDNGGNALWGAGTVSVGDGATYAASFENSDDGKSSVILDCGGGVQLNADTATPFYIVVPVGAFASGMSVKIETYAGVTTKSASKANTIVRSVIKEMPAFSIANATFTLPEFNIENASASEYMTSSNATFSSTTSTLYSNSFFQTANAITSYRSDQPATKTITFSASAESVSTKASASSSATILLSHSSDYSNPVLTASVELTDGSGSFGFTNLVPGNNYYYKVTDESGNILTAGAFRTTGQLRMIAIDDSFNIRDLGGWTGLGSKTVRYEQLYRGGSLGGADYLGVNDGRIGTDSQNELYRLGIRAQLDLRAAKNEGKWTGESSYHSYSRGVTTLLDADFNNTMTDYGDYNQDASVVSDVAWIIYELKKGKPVYYGCRQGADRTGAVSFIIEGLLGCSQSLNFGGGDQMAIDYEITSFSHAEMADMASDISLNSAVRSAATAYGTTDKLFNQIINLSTTEVTLENLQQKCYYYLNRYWTQTTATNGHTEESQYNISIDKDDLDWFIQYMLGMSDSEYSSYKPSWAFEGGDLKTVAEANANVFSYK